MASGRCFHIWSKSNLLNQLYRCHYTNVIQCLHRTISSPMVFVGHARSIHSSLSQCVPRGTRAPFAAATKTEAKDESSRVQEKSSELEGIKDGALAGTFIIGRKSELGSFNKKRQISSLKSGANVNFVADEMFYDDDDDSDEKLIQHNHQPERTFSSKSFSERRDKKLHNNDEFDVSNVRRKKEYDQWSTRDGRGGLSKGRQQWHDNAWFSSNGEEGARTTTKASPIDNNSQGRNTTGTRPTRKDDSSMRRITSPKLSEAFQYTDGDLLAEGDDKWTSNRSRPEKREWKSSRNGKQYSQDDDERKSSRNDERRSRKGKKAEWWQGNQGDRRSDSLQNIPADHEVLYGIAPCLLALQKGKRVVHQAFISPSFQESTRSEVRNILSSLDSHQVEVKVVHRNELDRLSTGHTHQGICLETSPLESFMLSDREEVLKAQLETFQQAASGQQHSVILALDQVKDPMNFGAVLRSSYYLGVDRVITCVQNSCPLSPVVSKASSGVMEVYDIYAAQDMPTFLQCMASFGWLIVGACSSTFAANRDGIECVPCHQFSLTQPTILVIGNEGYGMRSKVEEACSKLITIHPGRNLHPGIDSLNVSVATGILLHSLLGRGK